MRKSMSKKIIALVLLGTVLQTSIVSAAEVEKSESVYVNLDSEGDVEKETVSNWIHSSNGNLNIDDVSELNNIVNLKGIDKPLKSGNNLKWNVKSSDLFYQGSINKDLPIELKINYYLNGKKTDAKKIAGKSGKIKIEIEVINKVYEDKTIKGKQKRIYTPFSTALEVTLPVDKFSSVKCDGGTLLSEGKTSIATFVAFPGLKESLDVDKLDLDINLSNKFTIEADVKEFSLAPIMIVATPELPNLDKIEEADTISKLKSELNQLNDGATQLSNGSNKLYKGVLDANSKLNNGKSLMNSNNVREGLSMLQSDFKMNQARKLIDDAYYAKNIDVNKAKEILNTFTNKDISNLLILTNDTKSMMMYEEVLIKVINSVENLNRDGNLSNSINIAKEMLSKYNSLTVTTRQNLGNLLQNTNADTLTKVRKVAVETNGIKEDFQPVITTINNEISAIPGEDMQTKTVQYIYGLRDKLSTAEGLLNSSTSEKLNLLAGDFQGYASSYLILKSQLAYATATGGAEGFENKKAEIKAIINGVYGASNPNGAAQLSAYIDSLSLSDVSGESIATDSAKIGSYKEELPTIINGVNSLSGMSDLISTMNSVLSKEGEAERIAQLLGDLNDPTVQSVINSLGNTLIQMSDEDIRIIGDMISTVNLVNSQLQANSEAINNLIDMINKLGGNTQLVADLNKFKGDLDSCKETLTKVDGIMGNLDVREINNLKEISNNLFSMQKDLIDSEDILRITNSALEKENINQARNLINSLPVLTSGINQLVSGVKELDDGMNKYKNEGIDKLYSSGMAGIEDAEELLAIKDELVTQSKAYNTFSGKSEEMNGKVKFIMKTEEVSYEKKKETKKKTKEKETGFIAWLKDIFGID